MPDVTVLFWVSYVAMWGLLVFLSLALLGVVRTVYGGAGGEETRPDSDLALKGHPAPHFVASDMSGAEVDADDFVGQRTALLFVSPDCPTCALTLDELDGLEAKSDGNVIVLCRGEHEECSELVERHGLQVPLAVDHDLAISDLYEVRGAPTAVLIDQRGIVENYGIPMSFEDFKQQLKASGGAEHVHVTERS